MDYLYEETTVYLILFVVAFFASLIDSIAGGGGLLTTPSMLLVGIPPLNVLATNKFQSCFGTFTSTYNYYRNGLLVEKKKTLYFALSFIGSSIGTLLVSRISNETLESIIPILLIGEAIFFITNKGPSGVSKNERLLIIFNLVVFAIGFYDGFFGPGTGSFFTVSGVALRGKSLIDATANAKALNFATNIGSLFVFLYLGEVIASIAAIMILGQLIGARIGSKFLININPIFLRYLVIFLCTLMLARYFKLI